jgi:hypothetical protein
LPNALPPLSGFPLAGATFQGRETEARSAPALGALSGMTWTFGSFSSNGRTWARSTGPETIVAVEAATATLVATFMLRFPASDAFRPANMAPRSNA